MTTLAVSFMVLPLASAPDSRGGDALEPAASGIVTRRGCADARRGLAFYRSRYNDHLERRGAQTKWPVGRKPRNCADARFLARIARKRAYRAREAAKVWLNERTLRDFRVVSGASAWLRAIEEAQKVYPGTGAWLRSCSASEGGHGRWVPNSQGSGVGGWLQMFPSTFWRMFTAARADARSRGFRVPASAASWYSPLGQALGGAWAIRNGRRHEWVGHGC